MSSRPAGFFSFSPWSVLLTLSDPFFRPEFLGLNFAFFFELLNHFCCFFFTVSFRFQVVGGLAEHMTPGRLSRIIFRSVCDDVFHRFYLLTPRCFFSSSCFLVSCFFLTSRCLLVSRFFLSFFMAFSSPFAWLVLSVLPVFSLFLRSQYLVVFQLAAFPGVYNMLCFSLFSSGPCFIRI